MHPPTLMQAPAHTTTGMKLTRHVQVLVLASSAFQLFPSDQKDGMGTVQSMSGTELQLGTQGQAARDLFAQQVFLACVLPIMHSLCRQPHYLALFGEYTSEGSLSTGCPTWAHVGLALLHDDSTTAEWSDVLLTSRYTACKSSKSALDQHSTLPNISSLHCHLQSKKINTCVYAQIVHMRANFVKARVG